MKISRRTFGLSTIALAAAAVAPQVMAAARPNVVVVGGGAGGGTVARYLAKAAKGDINITLIEPTRTYYTCFFSNLYLGGFRDFSSIGHSYGMLASEYGINVVHDWATAVDRNKKMVKLASGADVPYDRLVLSPGIDFNYESVPGYGLNSTNNMPHAWKAGSQTQLLKAQVDNMREGGTYIMVAPPNPFRCPPGPYERVSMVAHILKKNNPKAKIIILDPKEKFSKQALFQEGWSKHYPGMIEWLPGSITGEIERVDAEAMEIHAGGEVFKADVANVIPGQHAGKIALSAGLANETGFCPIVPATMQSQMDENIYLVGDTTIAGDMPKSGFSANSQAKVAAMALRASLTGSKLFPARFANTCWSLIDTNDGVKVGAKYEATDEKIAKTEGFISKTGEDAQLRQRTYEESIGWYDGITKDIFG